MISAVNPEPDAVNDWAVEGVPKVVLKGVRVPVVLITAGGAGMLKALEITSINPLDANEIVAPVTATALVAVSPLNVVVPAAADTEAPPPRVHVPVPTAAVTVALLVVKFPYWSRMVTTG